MPEQLFYNTGIASYVWLLSNRKKPGREGLVQLIDSRTMWAKMRKSLGEKRRYLTAEQIAEVTRLHGAMEESDVSKLVPVDQFGYRTIVVDRPLRARWEIGPKTWVGLADDKPLSKQNEEARAAVVAALQAMPHRVFSDEAACRDTLRAAVVDADRSKPTAALVNTLLGRCAVRDAEAEPVLDGKGRIVADPELRDTETVPLADDVDDYLALEVLPHVPDAWVPDKDGKIGYEIPFTRLFYRYTPPRPSNEIKAELRDREA